MELRIGDYQSRVEYTLAALDEQSFATRLWEKDLSLWRQGPDGEKVIANRLGWLNIIEPMIERTDEITAFAEEVRSAGFTHAVLMGMGGSSLSPEVSRLTFGVADGYLDLMVLDSTVPSAVTDVESRIDLKKTLFLVSTKSGTTVETLSAYRYFYDKLRETEGDAAGSHFAAITDSGTPLQSEAKEKGFRRVFTNPTDIGGRYSALSYFGLVPAALIGADVRKILASAKEMAKASGSDVPAAENPGILLGTVMAELAMEGREKLTLILSPQVASLGSWIEQLVAESTGKSGRGVVPVDGEPIASAGHYGDDRLFVYVRLDSALDAQVQALEEAGQPVLRIPIQSAYDLGGQYLLWELATAVSSAIMGVNSFDEPNVKESKDNTNRLLATFTETGSLPEERPVLEEGGIKLYCDAETKAVLDRIRRNEPHSDASLLSYVEAHLDQFQPGNYFALMAFIQPTGAARRAFGEVRCSLRDAYSAATTLGWGPRFLHSTGQLHKGGQNNGVFIQITADSKTDVPIPGAPYTFGVLAQAQAMGDAIALRDKGRPMIRLHLSDVESGLSKLREIVEAAVAEQE
ncbi:MAG: hypothetical protein ACYC2Y_02590 [Armatimonadota bacterium]